MTTDTPLVDAIAFRLKDETDLFCDGKSLLQYNDLLFLARQLERELAEARKDAERYRALRRGQKWSVINGIGDILRAEELDAAIDAAMQPSDSPRRP